MTMVRFNEIGILTSACPRIHKGKGPQRVDVSICEGCKRIKEIDWTHKTIACGGKISAEDIKINEGIAEPSR
jgi:hypothetical protein